MLRLSAAFGLGLLTVTLAVAQRLPEVVRPENYKLTFVPDLDKATFEGDETISVRVLKATSEVTLHAVNINFHDVTITSGGNTQIAKVAPEKDKEMVALAVEKPLSAGSATIRITYTGILNDEMSGFYLGKDDQGRKYAATQFEATDARRAFPSFDEPDYKATFDITAVVDKGQVAISNSKVDSDTPSPGDKHTVRFATTPQMSSYLAALLVGNFEYIEGEADGIPIRVYTTPGKEEMGRFALESAKHVLSYYDQYFNVRYPYGKLDLIAVPDFSGGAMENTGCITFREEHLLIDEKQGSEDLKKTIASGIAHEMAHQWFGNLVTMKWWDDLWLNEGFATWMASKPIEAWKPEWNFRLDNVSDTKVALESDSLANTRPIQQAPKSSDQIMELFDGISYGKAASVLRMIEAELGERTFRAGVNVYLQRHLYANATASDFWDAQAETSRKPVDKIMSTFVKQAGVPIIDVKSRCSGASTRVTVSQRRYYDDRKTFQAPNDEIWQVPLCLKSSSGTQQCELLTKRQEVFTLPRCSKWILANAGAMGYYRVGYEPDAVRALARDVESKLSPAERIVLQADIWASVRVGREPVGDYLALANGLQVDRNRAVVEDLLRRLKYIGQYLVEDNDRESYRVWLRQFLNPVMKDVGWESKLGEGDEQRTLRVRVFNALGYDAGDPEVLAQARKIADKALTDPASVDQELAESAINLAALNGDTEFYERLMGSLKNAKSPAAYHMYLFALAQFSDQKLLQRTLEFAISPEVRLQDAPSLIARVVRNPSGEQLGWDFVRQHWASIGQGDPHASSAVVAAAGSFCDAGMRAQVVDFYTTQQLEKDRAYRQSIESIDNCIDLKSQQEMRLASWLRQHISAGRQWEAQRYRKPKL